MTTVQTARRPFHESIIQAIHWASSEELRYCVARIIKMTKIPKGHDEIIEAWNQRRRELNWSDNEDLGVPADLLEQKREAAEKEQTSST